MPPLAAGIIAGGKSSRMGSDKAFLDADGRPLISLVAERLGPLTDEIVVAVRDTAPYDGLKLHVIQDRLSPACPLAGLHAILSEIRAPAAFVCATDMPYLNLDLIRHLHRHLEKSDAVVPEGPHGPERLYAIYSKGCLPAIESALQANRLAIPQFYDDCNVLRLPIEERAWRVTGESPFTNLNTPEEYEAFRARLGKP